MNTPTKAPKLPAHLQPWPEHWLPKTAYLDAIKEPRHYWKIVPLFAADAPQNQVSAALKRLVATGEATRTDKNFYQATGHVAPDPGQAPQTWNAAEVAAACERVGIDPVELLAALRGEEPEPEPDEAEPLGEMADPADPNDPAEVEARAYLERLERERERANTKQAPQTDTPKPEAPPPPPAPPPQVETEAERAARIERKRKENLAYLARMQAEEEARQATPTPPAQPADTSSAAMLDIEPDLADIPLID